MKKCISILLALMMLLIPFYTAFAYDDGQRDSTKGVILEFMRAQGMDTSRGIPYHIWNISTVGSEYDEWIPELLRIALMRTYMHRCTLCGEYYYTTERVAIYTSTMDTDLA